MQISRKKTKEIRIGKLKIGGNNQILIQSMCNTDMHDVQATVGQIQELEKAGCEIVRVAVPDMEAAKKLGEIKKRISLPLVADIHFDYKLALEAIEQGIDKLRINPGNIGKRENVEILVKKCQEKKIPIRIGVNGGSLERDILEKYGDKATAEGMLESALRHVQILEDLNFFDICISVKASDVPTTVEAYRLLSEKVDYPLHLGVTEAGSVSVGGIKSAVGLGILLSEGIGDTLRVSLSGNPVEEVKVAWEVLKSLKLRQRGVEITSCPTCGRTKINLVGIVDELEKKTAYVVKPVHIAVMGCEVNGPGEAKTADIGVIGGDGKATIWRKGEFVEMVEEDLIVQSVLELTP